MTPSSTFAIRLSQQAQHGEVGVACGGARIRTTLPPFPVCGRGSSLHLGSTGGQSPASMGIKAQCGLRCDVPTPHGYRLLATHYSLRAHSGEGVAGGNDQASDHFTAAVDGGRCRRGLLRQSRIPTNQRGSVSEYRAMTTATAWRRSSPCSGDQDCFDGLDRVIPGVRSVRVASKSTSPCLLQLVAGYILWRNGPLVSVVSGRLHATPQALAISRHRPDGSTCLKARYKLGVAPAS